jgi:hypothetical protein
MKITISLMMALGVLIAPLAAQANVNFSTDTTTVLVGTFSVTGTTVEAATPSAFDFGLSFCLPVRVSRGVTATAGLQCAGSPDDPRAGLTIAGAQTASSVSGMTNALAGTPVPTFYFRFYELRDTGGTSGTFSGAFCFSRDPADCIAVESAMLSGFYPPVDSPSVATNYAKAGQTIPLRFYAATANGPITDLGSASLAITGVTCADLSTAEDSLAEYSTNTAVALENLGGGYYQYNWTTSKADSGTCKSVALFLPATYTTPTHPTATFQFSRK